jgi:phosphatidate cytidylyltransferase
MKQRILTGAMIAIVVVAAFLLRSVNITIFDTFIAIAIVFSVGEVSRVFNRSGKVNHMELAIVFAVSVYLSIIWGINASFGVGAYILMELALLALFFTISFFLTYVQKKQVKNSAHFKQSGQALYEYALKKALRTLFVMVYPTLLLSFLYFINHIEELPFNLIETAYNGAGASPNLGFMLLALTFLATMAADTFAYFVGSFVGGPKLAPLISPKKTVSGAIGGVIGSVLVATVLFFILNANTSWNVALFQAEVSVWHFVVYGLIASVISQMGDLFASIVKRRARAKDFSSIFPGHGGFMDRLDGVSFNAVFTFVYVILFFV